MLNEPTPVAERSKPSQACSSVQSNEVENRNEPTVTEEQSEIIRTMDADSSVLRQRRLTFYDVQNLPGKINLISICLICINCFFVLKLIYSRRAEYCGSKC